MHLSTMCHLLWWIGQGGNFYSLFGPKNTNLVEDIKILLPVKFRWIPRFQRKSQNMSQPIRGQGRYLVFLISPKNARLVEDVEILVEDVEILLPVKFCCILFSGFGGKVENVSANHRPGRPFCFPIPLKNTNLVEGVEILLPIKFRRIPFTVSEEKSKMSQPIRGQGGHFVFSRFAWKTQTW